VQRGFVGPLCHPQRQGGNRNAPAVEHAHGIKKTLAFGAEQSIGWKYTIFKNQFRCVGSPQTQLVFLLPGTKSRSSLFHHERGKPMRVRRSIRDRDHHQHVGIVAVRAKSLGSVQNPIVAFTNRHHASTAGVRTRGWLRKSPRPDKLSARKFWYVFLLLCIVASEKIVIRAQ